MKEISQHGGNYSIPNVEQVAGELASWAADCGGT